jgi:glycolate oxidase FAD binding subunit
MTLKTESEIAEFVSDAYSNKRKLRIIGGGTRQSLGNACQSETSLSTAGLTGISLYEPGALTVVAAAGTPVAAIEQALASEGQRLPFEPMDHRKLLGSTGTASIGGVVACNVSGPARIQSGGCRDSLIGVRFVDGRGEVVKNGGRVMKNVTGYDLVKLMCGSYGSLGVLTDVAFKVLPQTEMKAVLLIEGLSDVQAVEALSKSLSSPYEVSGAAHVQKGLDGTPVTMIRVEGFENSVIYRAKQLQQLLADFGDSTIETDTERTTAGWKWVRDVEAFADRTGDVWRISVKPSDGPKVAAKLKDGECIFDWGGGLIWALVPIGQDVRTSLKDISGFAERVRGDMSDTAQARVPQNPIVAKIEQGLRDQFDPKGILNSGIMG